MGQKVYVVKKHFDFWLVRAAKDGEILLGWFPSNNLFLEEPPPDGTGTAKIY